MTDLQNILTQISNIFIKFSYLYFCHWEAELFHNFVPSWTLYSTGPYTETLTPESTRYSYFSQFAFVWHGNQGFDYNSTPRIDH